MKKNIYCIKDVKSGFINPITAVNDNVAIRQYKMLLNNKDTEIGIFPADYELWRLGEFDTDTGNIEPGLDFICNYTIAGNMFDKNKEVKEAEN